MKLYVSKQIYDGNKSILNGKALILKVNPDGCLVVVDAETNAPIWYTTEIKSIQYVESNAIVTTQNNTYVFLRLSNVLAGFDRIGDPIEFERDETDRNHAEQRVRIPAPEQRARRADRIGDPVEIEDDEAN